eukprot:1194057-Prorocentrum_minimum.AAC.1
MYLSRGRGVCQQLACPGEDERRGVQVLNELPHLHSANLIGSHALAIYYAASPPVIGPFQYIPLWYTLYVRPRVYYAQRRALSST